MGAVADSLDAQVVQSLKARAAKRGISYRSAFAGRSRRSGWRPDFVVRRAG